MRIRCGTIHIVALAALVVGAAAGWFAASAWREEKCLPAVALAKAGGNMEAANDGRARSPSAPNGRAVSMKPPKEKAKSRRKTEANVEKQREPEVVKPEEKPAQAEQAEKKNDNPFPRYLDMFRNDPAALAAEFEKEAEADRARQREMRDKAIARLKLNAEQSAVFEKALDDLKNAILQHEQEEVDLIASGQMNMDTAADGRIWDSNLLLMDQCGADREKTVRDAAVELYYQLDVDSVSDSEKQEIIKWTTYNTSFSFDCYEPVLQVYDKVYKNMGFGKGIFSWCSRARRQGGK